MTYATILAVLLKFGAPDTTAPPVADAVFKYAHTPAEAAFVLAWGRHESRYLERIAANRCEQWECDHGKAIGLWQAHHGAAGTAWAHLPGNIDLQAFVAVRHARWALHECRDDARCAFRLLGATHGKELRGERERVADFERARRML